MTALLALIRKDLVLYFSNRRALIVGVLAPILMAGFFGYLFDPQASRPSRVDVVATDLDHSPISRQVLQALAADPSITLREAPQVQGREDVRRARARVAIVLPAGLGASAPAALFGAGPKPVLDLVYDPSQAMALAVVRGLLMQSVSQAVGSQVFSANGIARLRQSPPPPGLSDPPQRDLQQIDGAAERLQAQGAAAASSRVGLSLPVELHLDPAVAEGGRSYNGYSHAFAGMGVQFILFAGIEFGISVLLARRLGLWRRLRAAPLTRSQLLGSRIISGALIALVLVLAIFAAGIAVFGVRIHGSVAGFVAVSAAFALVTSAFGMLIAAFGRTPEATRSLAILATLVMVMLGGAWVPSFLFPDWVQTLALSMPARWAVDGFDAMTWRGLPLQAAWPPTLALLGFALLFTLLAIWRFDWEE